MMLRSMVIAAFAGLATVGGAGAQDTTQAVPVRPPVRSSWTSDQVELQVGDIVTILIDEYTLATADRNESASREKGRFLIRRRPKDSSWRL